MLTTLSGEGEEEIAWPTKCPHVVAVVGVPRRRGVLIEDQLIPPRWTKSRGMLYGFACRALRTVRGVRGGVESRLMRVMALNTTP